ncbi:hypothetical protein, partial [Yanshouia hominis]|uniref:hypothetical protein n=1 Tax=Yanshouia hominis TaxID=2763673 RepID=UPI0021CCCE7E
HHLLERACVSFVWYSFPHNKAPHFLVQVYHTCLTNGVQFKIRARRKNRFGGRNNPAAFFFAAYRAGRYGSALLRDLISFYNGQRRFGGRRGKEIEKNSFIYCHES